MSTETKAIYDPAAAVLSGIPMRSSHLRAVVAGRVREAIAKAHEESRGDAAVIIAKQNSSIADIFDAKNAEIQNLRESIHELQRQHATALISCARRGADSGPIQTFETAGESE